MPKLSRRFTVLGRVCLLAALIAIAPPHPLHAQTPPPGYNKLQDIYVFKDALLGTWSGGDLVAPGSNVPIDTTQMYNGLPSLSYDIQGPNQWWWQSILAGQDWRTYSIEYYYPDGFLEFNVKGAVGGERFNIQLTDLEPEGSNAASNTVNSGNFFTVTTDWQGVKIPLSALVPAGQPFRFRQMRQVNLSESYSGPYAKHFWINSLRFTSPDTEHIYPAIKVDQVGYLLFAQKYALVSGFGETLTASAGTPFEVRRTSDGLPVYSGTLSLVADYDQVSGERVLQADFSNLIVPGTYYLTVDATGIDPSPAFRIGLSVYKPLLRDAMRFYYHQRQGIAIVEPYAEGFARGVGHPGDVTAKFRSSGVIHDVSHGWYDAGDFGKYTPFAAGVIVDLLDAYTTFPFAFPDNQLNIPESGNGKPDILDEVKWELDWLVKMQDPVSGGFYHLVYPNNCPASGSCRVEDITEQRYIEDLMGGVPNVRPTTSTAKAVAALARAAGVYRWYDPTLAQSYLTAAQNGWAYLLANPNNIPATGFNGQQSTDDQERLWAAAELFRATGQRQYSQYFLARYQNYQSVWTNLDGNAGDVAMRAFLAYNGSLFADHTERAWFKNNFRQWRATQLARTQSTWRNFQPYWGYYWGSNAVTLQTIVVLTLGDITTGTFFDPEVLNAAREQLHYVLGTNPLRHSFVSGYGGDSVQTLYSQLYSGYGLYSPPPGYLPGGPDIYDSPHYSQFAAKCYGDTNTDWPPSEPAIYYNAYLVFTTALVDQTGFLPAQ